MAANATVAPRGVFLATLSISLLLATIAFVLSLGATLEALVEKYVMNIGTSTHDQFLALFIPVTCGIGIAAVSLLLTRIAVVRRKRRV